MDMKIYKSIINIIERHQGLSRDCLETLKETFPQVNPDTLYSILSLEYQKQMKAIYIKNPSNMKRICDVFHRLKEESNEPGIFIKMAKELHICPYLIGKIILQKYFEEQKYEEFAQLNNCFKNTALIPDMDLAYEMFLCNLYDNLYSPLSEIMKHSLGQEYEIKLYKSVEDLSLSFYNEEQLRIYGYDKTPDIKLEVPVAIDGFVVNWIESKALFGDEHVHQEYTKNQYLSYWNRFGPGLVIYWFGFNEKIQQFEEKRFIIRDTLPTNIQDIMDLM